MRDDSTTGTTRWVRRAAGVVLTAVGVCGAGLTHGSSGPSSSAPVIAGEVPRVWTQAAKAPAPTVAGNTAEEVVRTLYARVTFDAGKNVDWQQVKALFIPEAVIVLRTSRTAMSVLSLDGFVGDFVNFIKQAKLEEQAFEETIVSIKTQEHGDIARSIVHYAARIPSNGRPAQDGIDIFVLMKRDGAWRIVSIVNEVVRPGVPVPEELRK